MNTKIKVGAVSYLNTKPLLYGLTHSDIANDIDIILDYPAQLAKQLNEGTIDLALLPVAAMKGINNAEIISDYGIAANGNVVSVAIFSQVPIEEITTVYLDYQSRTSVRLAELLLKHYWKKDVVYKQAPENYIEYINDTTAGVIIGDRALRQLYNFEYIYDLSAGWNAWTGLDFVFAAWVANKPLPEDFKARFNAANASGLEKMDTVIEENPFPYYDLHTYYHNNICFQLDEQKKQGLAKFLELLNS